MKHVFISREGDKAQFVKNFESLQKLSNEDLIEKYNKAVDLSKDHLSYMQLHYLYVRSFYPELKPTIDVQKIMDYYQNQIPEQI